MTEQDTNNRLDRIETKVDKLVDTMANLVRIEEKLHMHQQGMQRLGDRVDKLEQDIDPVIKKMPLINILLSAVGKIGITVLLLITAGIIGSFFVFK